jgi:hypothetical protein
LKAAHPAALPDSTLLALRLPDRIKEHKDEGGEDDQEILNTSYNFSDSFAWNGVSTD